MRVPWLLWNAAFALLFATAGRSAEPGKVFTGQAAMGDWATDAPGVRRKITVEDLPPPSSNRFSIDPPHDLRRPKSAQPQVPPGFKIEVFASHLRDPRFLL